MTHRDSSHLRPTLLAPHCSLLTRITITILLLVALIQPASAQQVRAYLSADSVRVGDRFSLTLVAEHTFIDDPIFPGPEAGEEYFGNLEVLGVLGSGSRLAAGAVAGTRIDSLIYEATTFALDTAYVPSIPVFFVDGGDTSFVASYPLELPVISLVPEEADGIRDLAPIAEFPVNPWPWILGFLLLAGLAAGGYYYWKRYRPIRPATVLEVPEPQISPLEEAIKRLRHLEKTASLQDRARIKPFYVELTEILRVYLSRRLHLNAMESTSHELLWDLKNMIPSGKITKEALQVTRRILHVSDLVKFADMHPGQEVGHQAFRETRKLLDMIEASLQPVMQEAEAEPEVIIINEHEDA